MPMHGGSQIEPPLFHKILGQPGISAEDYSRLK
jgi:hypothetical protein